MSPKPLPHRLQAQPGCDQANDAEDRDEYTADDPLFGRAGKAFGAIAVQLVAGQHDLGEKNKEEPQNDGEHERSTRPVRPLTGASRLPTLHQGTTFPPANKQHSADEESEDD